MDREPTTIFTDRHGKIWDLEITLASAKRIDKADFSIVYDGPVFILDPEFKMAEDQDQSGLQKMILAMISNTGFSAFMAYLILQPQLKEDPKFRVIESEEERQEWFTERLNSKSLEELRQALVVAYGNFIPALKTFLTTTAGRLIDGRRRLEAVCNESLKKLDMTLEVAIQSEEKKIRKILDTAISQAVSDTEEHYGGLSGSTPVR